MPNTLLDLYSLTKGSEYVVIGGFLFLFISFWRFLTYKDKD
ncbi:MAG: DNA-binding protein [Deltaproteobacteria bacterium]|nr:DNA-binding protein [Deltaproteobacteria bacterium]